MGFCKLFHFLHCCFHPLTTDNDEIELSLNIFGTSLVDFEWAHLSSEIFPHFVFFFLITSYEEMIDNLTGLGGLECLVPASTHQERIFRWNAGVFMTNRPMIDEGMSKGEINLDYFLSSSLVRVGIFSSIKLI